MKLRNKKTGEIEEFENITRVFKFLGNQNTYNSLAELNEEWEDYEEPKEYWYIYGDGCLQSSHLTHTIQEEMKQIGNYFETQEEAEKAVEKLKAWKRLKDKGFRFKSWEFDNKFATEMPGILIRATKIRGCEKDLDLLFGGEE